jgi:hypothetical protein
MLGGVAVLAAIACVTVARLTSAEVFMRMALGRVALSDLHPAHDPFLFAAHAPFVNPEWLGDVVLYGCYQLGGESALVALRIVIVCTGALLLLVAARRTGSHVGVATLLVSAVVLTTGLRWNERNEMHLVWLVPAYLCLLRPRRHWVRWTLLPLGVIWANVHASFVVGWVLVFAAGCDAWMEGDRRTVRQLAVILVLHPLLPLISPSGLDVYRFVWEHHQHSDWLARNIAEWIPASERAATVREGVLHVLVLVTLVTFLAPANRRAIGRFVIALAGVALIYRAIRFAPISAMLLAIACGANLAAISISRRVRVAAASVVTCVVLYAGITGRNLTAAKPHPLSETGGASSAARWLGEHASAGSSVFHPFNQSQLLMWFAPQVKLVVHAHTPYVGYEEWRAASTDAAAFEALVERQHVDYVLAYAQAASTAPAFWAYMDRHPRWQRVYSDQVSAVFARRPGNAP